MEIKNITPETKLNLEEKNHQFNISLYSLKHLFQEIEANGDKINKNDLQWAPIGENYLIITPTWSNFCCYKFCFGPYIHKVYPLKSNKFTAQKMHISTHLECEQITPECFLLLNTKQIQNLIRIFPSWQIPHLKALIVPFIPND